MVSFLYTSSTNTCINFWPSLHVSSHPRQLSFFIWSLRYYLMRSINRSFMFTVQDFTRNILSLPRVLQAPHVSPVPGKKSQPHGLQQGCTNIGRNVSVATKFFTLAPSVYGSSERNLLHVTLLTSWILRCFPDFLLKICAFLVYRMCFTSQLESLPNFD